MAKWKKVLKKVASPVVKPLQKFAKKFLPRELRPFLPMATAFMPYTGIMGAMGGPMGFAKMYSTNLLAQAMADPDAEFDDLNQFAALLSGTQGGLMGTKTAGNLRDMTTKGSWMGRPDAITGGPQTLEKALADRSFWDKTKDLGLEGLATASDYLQGGADTLGALGSGEAINVADAGQAAIMKDLFTKQGAIEAAKAAAVPFSTGMGGVTEVYQRPAIREFEQIAADEAAQMEETTTANEQEQADLTMKYYRQAGHDEETIQEALEINGLGDYYEPPVTAAQGGIIGLRNGGRIRFALGGDTMASRLRELIKKSNAGTLTSQEEQEMEQLYIMLDYGPGEKNGGIIGLKEGGMLNFGGREMDLRGGGFVPIGRKERADDVPARLSKNEFVMTADAVRAAGGGNVNKGAQRMYDVMNNLEARA